jgi:hypothetical protein
MKMMIIIIIIITYFFNLCFGTLGIAATTGLFYEPRMIGDGDCGAIGRGNRSTCRKPVQVPLRPPEIQHDMNPGSNTDRCGGKLATSRLSYDTA